MAVLKRIDCKVGRGITPNYLKFLYAMVHAGCGGCTRRSFKTLVYLHACIAILNTMNNLFSTVLLYVLARQQPSNDGHDDHNDGDDDEDGDDDDDDIGSDDNDR